MQCLGAINLGISLDTDKQPSLWALGGELWTTRNSSTAPYFMDGTQRVTDWKLLSSGVLAPWSMRQESVIGGHSVDTFP